jgi:hypothetical protein
LAPTQLTSTCEVFEEPERGTLEALRRMILEIVPEAGAGDLLSRSRHSKKDMLAPSRQPMTKRRLGGGGHLHPSRTG